MPYTSPAAIVTGTTISKTTFGDVVKADLDFLATPPACRAYHNANQSLTHATLTALAMNSEREDTDLMHDNVTNNTRITFKTAGRYVVTAQILWASNATGERALHLRLNGAVFIGGHSQTPVNGSSTAMSVTTQYKFAANDYIELMAFQASGGALNVLASDNVNEKRGCEAQACWVGLG